MNPADEEINLFLPLMFGLTIFCLCVLFALIGWFLIKMNVINISKNGQMFSVIKAVILSVGGVLILYGIISVVMLFFQVIRNLIMK